MRQFIILLILASTTVYGQELNGLVFKTDSTTIFENKFDFSSLAAKTDINTKIDFVIDNIISKDTTSIHFYTLLDSYYNLLRIRKDYKEIYSIIDTAEINRNLHFIDFNFDGKLDCVYDRLNFADDNLQFIFLFLNKNGQFNEMRISGFFITKYYEREGNSVFETFRWACCEEHFNHFNIFELNGDSLIEISAYIVPVNLRIRNHFTKIGELNNSKEYYIYEDYNNPFLLKEKNVPIQIIGENIKIFDSIEIGDISWKLIEGEINNSSLNSNRIKIIGWIKDEK